MKTHYIKAALSTAALAITSTALAADGGDDSWQFGVTVPIWAAGIDGDVTVRGVTQDLDIGFDELTDHLDASFSLGLEARKGRFGLYSGIGYMKFSAEGSGPLGGESDAELKILIADIGVSYEILRRGEERPFVLEAIAGIRYWHVGTDLTVRGPAGAQIFDGSNNHDLYDPIIGLRFSQYFSEKWHFDFQGDIGGFGISDDHTSDLDWSLTGLISYDIATWFTLSAGYKALAVELENDSGQKGVDIVMNGALLTAKFKF